MDSALRHVSGSRLQLSPSLGRVLERSEGPRHPARPRQRERGRSLEVCASLATRGSSSRRLPREENAPGGDFFVDHTCIDCDTCRWMAPDVFSRVGGMSAVHHQPENEGERLRALQALLACPTASIHTRQPPKDIRAAQETFPLPVSQDLPGVYHCGFHSEKSYGATAFFVQTPRGNFLVDSPRYTDILAKKLESMGGVDVIFLTHRDDVADHDKWARRFRCPRVMHSGDVTPGTKGMEVLLQGEGPWDLFALATRGAEADTSADASAPSPSGPTIVHTPGHTLGSCCLLLPAGTTGPVQVGALFSGDHVAHHRTGALTLFPGVNRAGLALQGQSARALAGLPFLWLLPGHGRRVRFRDEGQRAVELQAM